MPCYRCPMFRAHPPRCRNRDLSSNTFLGGDVFWFIYLHSTHNLLLACKSSWSPFSPFFLYFLIQPLLPTFLHACSVYLSTFISLFSVHPDQPRLSTASPTFYPALSTPCRPVISLSPCQLPIPDPWTWQNGHCCMSFLYLVDEILIEFVRQSKVIPVSLYPCIWSTSHRLVGTGQSASVPDIPQLFIVFPCLSPCCILGHDEAFTLIPALVSCLL